MLIYTSESRSDFILFRKLLDIDLYLYLPVFQRSATKNTIENLNRTGCHSSSYDLQCPAGIKRSCTNLVRVLLIYTIESFQKPFSYIGANAAFNEH